MNETNTRRRKMRGIQFVLAGLALAGGIASYAAARPPRERAMRSGNTATGVIERFTTAPGGEVDGARLADGSLIHWPPHVGERVSDLVAVGDRVEVVGRRQTNPEGISQLEAESIANVRSGQSLKIADFPPEGRPAVAAGGPAAQMRPAGSAEGSKRIEGQIRRFTYAPRGEVDGAELTDGTLIHWPPHLENQFAGQIEEGGRVAAWGVMETGPDGETRLEASRLVAVRRGGSSSDDDGPTRGSERISRDGTERRIDALEDQIDQLWREIARLRRNR